MTARCSSWPSTRLGVRGRDYSVAVAAPKEPDSLYSALAETPTGGDGRGRTNKTTTIETTDESTSVLEPLQGDAS